MITRSIIKGVSTFAYHLSLQFWNRPDKMMIVLPPKLYDHAWRELVDEYRSHISLESEDIPPKSISFYTFGFEIVIKPMGALDKED